MTTSEKAVAAMKAPPIGNDTIPDGDEVKFAITKEGSAACCRLLMGNLKDIEANPGDRNIQAEFLARRDLLWERMNAADQTMVDGEHARVRELVKPKKRLHHGSSRPPRRRKRRAGVAAQAR